MTIMANTVMLIGPVPPSLVLRIVFPHDQAAIEVGDVVQREDHLGDNAKGARSAS